MNVKNIELIKKFNAWKVNNVNHTAQESKLYPDDDHWGDKMGAKNDEDIRISMENINNIGKNSEINPKQDYAWYWIINNKIDIVNWIEVGIAWNKIRYKDRLLRRMRFQEWQNPTVVTLNNKTNIHQYLNQWELQP